MTKEQQIIKKQDELIDYYKKLSVPFTFDWNNHPVEWRRKLHQLESELSQLKSTLEKEQLSGTININPDTNSVTSGEQSEISAEETLDKYILQAKDQGLKVEIKGRYWVEKAMHDFRNQGRDWEKIEKEFIKDSNLYLHDLPPEWIINWFKNNL